MLWQTDIADPPLIPGMLPSAGPSVLSLFLRVCLLWLSLFGGAGGGGGLLQGNHQNKEWNNIRKAASPPFHHRNAVSPPGKQEGTLIRSLSSYGRQRFTYSSTFMGLISQKPHFLFYEVLYRGLRGWGADGWSNESPWKSRLTLRGFAWGKGLEK